VLEEVLQRRQRLAQRCFRIHRFAVKRQAGPPTLRSRLGRFVKTRSPDLSEA
jgi:hypothetical protein